MTYRKPFYMLAGAFLGMAVAASASAASDSASESASAATLQSLSQKHVDVHKSKAPRIDPQTVLDNYKALLKNTRAPDRRLRVMRRLADAELVVALRGHTNAKQLARHAITLYRKVLKSSDYKKQRAKLLYNVARACDIVGDTAGGITAFDRLINHYPDSPFFSESHFRRAQMRFSLGSYKRAANDYKWLIDNDKDSPYRLQAQYKLAWTDYKLAGFKDSLAQFGAVLKHLLGDNAATRSGELDVSNLSHAQSVVAKDSLRGMILDFAQLKDEFPPSAFVKQADMHNYSDIFYNKLYSHYIKKQRFTDASRLAVAYVKTYPDSPHMHTFETRAIKALEDGGFRKAARQRKAAFVQRYGVNKHKWNGQDPLQIASVRKRLHAYLDEIAHARQAQAHKSRKAPDYLRVADWYATYRTVFPDDAQVAKLAYLQAQALEQADQFEKAAGIYAQVAYAMGDNKHAADAGYAAVLDLRKAAGDTVASDAGVEAATLKFAQTFPADPHAAKVLMRLAGDRYRAGAIDAASKLAKRVIAHQPAPAKQQLVNAWRIRVAATEKNNNYKDAETALRWLIDNAPGQDPTKLNQQLAAAIYNQGQALVKAGKDRAARKQFMRLLQTVSHNQTAAADIRSTALFDAAAASTRLDDKVTAIRLLKQFRQQYPDNELAPKATRNLAALYLDTGDKAHAADIFSVIRHQPGATPDVRRDAALRTAQLRAQTGQTQAAASAYENYVQGYQLDFDDAMEARAKLVKLYTQLGNTNRANDWRRQIIRANATAGTSRDTRSRTLAAHASLQLADQARAYFHRVKLTTPIKPALQAKQDGLKAALTAYGKATDYDIAEVSTAATFHIAHMYYSFGQALLAAPLPAGLSPEQQAQYKALLQQQADPFRSRAIAVQQSNIKHMIQGTRNQWTQKSLARLARLEQLRFGKQEALSETLVPTP